LHNHTQGEAMATDVMIEARDLTKIYRNQRAIDRLNFSIRRGEVVGFLGPNGAGKSTTMRILTCFIAPSSGTAVVGGNDVFENPLGARSVVGYLPQRAPLYTEMGVIEYLEFAADLRAIAKSDQKSRIRKVIDICGLGDALLKDIGELSHGYRQRVGLAQALLHDPPILILDEPTSDLDPNEKAEFIEYLKAIGRDRTVMLSTHNLAEVEASCPRVIIVSRGRIAADGTPDDLASRSGRARYVLVLDEQKRVKGESGLPIAEVTDAMRALAPDGEIKELPSDEKAHVVQLLAADDKDLRAELFRLAVDKGWLMLELRRDVIQLEEVFRELTVGADPGARLAGAGLGAAAADDDDDEDDEDSDDDEDDEDDDEGDEADEQPSRAKE
jgi:ABC-2 type transport system ATP-binding protein